MGRAELKTVNCKFDWYTLSTIKLKFQSYVAQKQCVRMLKISHFQHSVAEFRSSNTFLLIVNNVYKSN